MAKTRAWLGITGAFGLVALVACSSSSGGGGKGGCADMSGSWTMSGNCSSMPSTCTVTQSGCTATLSCDNGSASASVSGNSMSFTFQGAQCSGSVSNQVFNGSCSSSGSSCDVSASCSNGKCGLSQSGSGGAGGSGGGEGGSGGVPPGGSGGVSGSGGGPGQCGGTLYSNTPACQSCMETSCCSQLAACAPGTGCDNLFNCIVTYCSEDPSEQCLTTNCSNELQSGGQQMIDMFDCEEASCASACASEG